MLREILSPEDCANCRFCCVFQKESRWETPVISREAAEELKQFMDGKEITKSLPGENGCVLKTVRRRRKLEEGQEPYRCAALDERRGCRLDNSHKPFDCSLWPMRVMREDDRIYIVIARGCRAVNDDFLRKAETLLKDGLEKRIIEEVRRHSSIIKPSVPGYDKLKEITKALTPSIQR